MLSSKQDIHSVDIAPDVNPVQLVTAYELDAEAIIAKYKAERAKRIREDGIEQFNKTIGQYARFQKGPWSEPITRDPIKTETKVLVVGAGFGGLVTGVKLKDQGVDDFLIVEKGGDIGGTWYWNQYPGRFYILCNDSPMAWD